MKRIVLIIALVVLPCAVFAQNLKLGAGVIVGNPTGISGKYWIDSRTALDAAFSIVSRDEAYLHVSYLVHDFRAFPKPEEGRLPFYYGGGAVVRSPDRFGIRGVIGIEYIFAGYPFDIFLELAPVFTLSPGFDFGFTGGMGGRYFFNP